MTQRHTTVLTTFAPETRFDLEPELRPPPDARTVAELERLRITLVRRLVKPTLQAPVQRRLRRAITEAENLAFTTPFPLLVLPTLAEEMVHAANQAGATANRPAIPRLALTNAAL